MENVNHFVSVVSNNQVLCPVVSAMEYVEDFNRIKNISASGPCKSFTYKRLKGRIEMHL